MALSFLLGRPLWTGLIRLPHFDPWKSGKWFEAGRTEKLKDTLSPEWITRIPVDYFENEDSTCKFVVYDFDKNNTDLKKATFLGQYICDFGDIIKGGEKFRQECPMTAQDGESKFFNFSWQRPVEVKNDHFVAIWVIPYEPYYMSHIKWILLLTIHDKF